MYIFKVYNSVFLVFSEGYATILLSNFRNTFITSPIKIYTHEQSLPIHPTPESWQLQSTFCLSEFAFTEHTI